MQTTELKDLPVEQQVIHGVHAALGKVAAYLHRQFPEQITAEVAEEMRKVAFGEL